MPKLPDQLRAWRDREKLSQAEAAAKLGCSLRTIENWEQGIREPRGMIRTYLLGIIRKQNKR